MTISRRGRQIFAEHLTAWRTTKQHRWQLLTAQLQMAVADQLAAQDKTHQAELPPCGVPSERYALMAKAQWQDQRETDRGPRGESVEARTC